MKQSDSESFKMFLEFIGWNKPVNWLHIGLHAAISFVFGVISVWWLPLLYINSGFWFGREWGQHYHEPWRLFYRRQVVLEWVVPVLTAIVIWWFIGLFL